MDHTPYLIHFLIHHTSYLIPFLIPHTFSSASIATFFPSPSRLLHACSRLVHASITSLYISVLPRYCSATVLASVNLDPAGNPFIATGGAEEEEEAPPVIVFHDEL